MKHIMYSILIVIWTQFLPGMVTGLECYYCRSFELDDLSKYQQNNYTSIIMQMGNYRCRMDLQHNDTSKPLTTYCNQEPKKGKTMCVTYQGIVTTQIANYEYDIKTTTMDCKEVDINTRYQRNGIVEDISYFENLMYQLRGQTVQKFDGNMYSCNDKNCQLTGAGANTGTNGAGANTGINGAGANTGTNVLCSFIVVVFSLVMIY